jgi:hypothetical protein
MSKKLLALTIIGCLSTTPALAEIDTKRYLNLANVACEQEQTKADIEEIWSGLRNSSKTKLVSLYGQPKVIKATTRGKANGKLLCNLSIKYPGKTPVRGLMSLTVFSTGKWNLSWKPNY